MATAVKESPNGTAQGATNDQPSRVIARDWWRTHLDTDDDVSVTKLARQAVAELGACADFREMFVDDFIGSAMYDMGQRMLANHRAVLRTPEGLRRQVEKDMVREESRFQVWREYDPKAHVWVPLPQMTREQVLLACETRTALANENATEARWFKLIAAELQPGQRVGEELTDDQLVELRRIAASSPQKGT
jgi:hypothetical protein